jgi:hypothetical protein
MLDVFKMDSEANHHTIDINGSRDLNRSIAQANASLSENDQSERTLAVSP